jgi:hypothetical protein
MITPEEEEILIEAAAGAHRERTPEGIAMHPSWYDLDDAGRETAFDVARQMRALESALDPQGLSTTARAVLNRLPRR